MASTSVEEPAPVSVPVSVPAPASSPPSSDPVEPPPRIASGDDSALPTASSSSTAIARPPLAASPPNSRRQAASTSSSPGAPSSLSAFPPRLVRRQSNQERLDAILETARQRAQDITAAQPSRSGTSVRLEPLLRNQSAPGAMASPKSGSPAATAGAYFTEVDGNASADETTGIIAHNSRHGSARHLNYQSIASGSASPTSGARSRKSTAGGEQGGAAQATVAAAAAAAATADSAGVAGPSWWSWLLSSFSSIELENKGSVARDHLALERTFLAWLRTSLAFASIGIAVTQLFRLNTSTNDDGRDQFEHLRHLGRPLGTTFLAISILILFLGYQRYYQSQKWIIQGKFPASRGTIIIVSLVALGLMVASLVVVVVVQPAI